ncbi:MAG: PQQ-binding-like beta-propeller repeat protein [Actinomycetota bacterium]
MNPILRPLLLAAIVFSAAAARAEDWPQFRGPNGSGVSTSRGLPVQFSAKEKVLWQAALGDGIGCPVVAAGRVFSTAMTGPKRFTVFAHQANTGKLLWKKDFATGALPRITPPNSHASATPATDGKHVVVYFSTLGLLGFDAATGAPLWRTPVPKPAYLMDWGAGVSPILYQNLVIFCQDDDLSPYVAAFDVATGKQRWKTPRPDMLAGYAMPVMCQAGGRTDLVIAGTGKMKGYDPATGKELWTCNTLLRTIMTSPVVRDGVIYVAVQSYGDANRTLKFALLEWLDTNQDGKLVRAEVPEEFTTRFDASDKDKNGALEGPELDTAFQHPTNQVGGGSVIQAIRGGGTGDVTKTHLLWNVTNRSPSNLTSPLVVNDRLYLVKAGGLSSCFETGGGKGIWELERLKNLGDYYASPVYADGKVYVAGKNGIVIVLAEGSKLEVLARNDMGAEILATPAIADGRLFIRTRDRLYCLSAQAK